MPSVPFRTVELMALGEKP